MRKECVTITSCSNRLPCLACCRCRPAPDKQQKNGWMDEMYLFSHSFSKMFWLPEFKSNSIQLTATFCGVFFWLKSQEKCFSSCFGNIFVNETRNQMKRNTRPYLVELLKILKMHTILRACGSHQAESEVQCCEVKTNFSIWETVTLKWLGLILVTIATCFNRELTQG